MSFAAHFSKRRPDYPDEVVAMSGPTMKLDPDFRDDVAKIVRLGATVFSRFDVDKTISATVMDMETESGDTEVTSFHMAIKKKNAKYLRWPHVAEIQSVVNLLFPVGTRLRFRMPKGLPKGELLVWMDADRVLGDAERHDKVLYHGAVK